MPHTTRLSIALSAALCMLVMASAVSPVSAHCDRVNGPVALDAFQALEDEDFSRAQIWVGEEEEAELRARFDEALTVRQQGDAAREMADRYFAESAVRLHRKAEGMSFEGLQPAAEPSADIAAAERALETGDSAIVTDYLNERLVDEVQEWFRRAHEARQRRDASVEAGREWVDAYVKFVVFVHSLDAAIEAGPAHGVGDHH